jgi:aerobic-type carbon monoxide dehydrogenase small subunit (CoxS/CutS family)
VKKEGSKMLELDNQVSIMEEIINLTVNGEAHELRVQSQWTLQFVLQELLGLTGTKAFCTEGACGGCAVIVDGRAILSCMTLAGECDHKNIETIEGIAKAKHPIIEAYVKYSCMQCGYCTPGFIVTAKAFLDKNADPTGEEVKQALAGNLCRCGTYPQHIKAVLEAARTLREAING